jgi:AraC-like DNA-binding protein
MDLLRDRNNNVGDVAELACYSSAAHFAKVFKDITGKSPSVWRKSQ